MPAPPDMAYWLGQKYSILGKQAEGEYQKNVAEAYKTRAEGKEVPANAASLRDMQGSQSFLTREQGQQVAPNAASLRDLQGAEAYRAREQGTSEATGRYIDSAAAQIIRDAQRKAHPDLFAPPGTGAVLPGSGALTPGAAGPRSSLDLPSLTAPLQQIASASLRPMYKWNADTQSPEEFRKGTPDVKAKSSGGAPKGLEAMLPALLAAMQGGGAPAPAGPPAGGPPMPGRAGLKKGTANVKGKSKGSKASKDDGQPTGLEALLAALQGGGAADPQAAGPPMPMAPGAAAPPGFAQGVSTVRPDAEIMRLNQDQLSYDEWNRRDMLQRGRPGGRARFTVDEIGSRPGSALTMGADAVRRSGHIFAGEPGYGMPEPTRPVEIVRGSPSGFTRQTYGGPQPQPQPYGGQQIQYPTASVAQLAPSAPPSLPRFSTAQLTPDVPPGFARGTPNVDPRPGYPFGAGYLFGATAVPGQGSGTVDTVNAKLAPHEAVLNRAAADMLGRGLISALNNAGVRQMGLR